MVHGKTFRQNGSARCIPPNEVDDQNEKALLKSTGEELSISWEKNV